MAVNQIELPDVDGRWRRLVGRSVAGTLPGLRRSRPPRPRPVRGLPRLRCRGTATPARVARSRCRSWRRPRHRTCGDCLQRPPPLQATRAAFVYAAPLDRLLPRFKFHHDLAAGRLLAQLMAHALADAERPQALLPVPLHRARLRSRGYDQALELAKPLARALQVPLLRRRAGAHARHRAAVASSMPRSASATCAAPSRCDPRVALPAHVVLVDDVMTTGATLHAAAIALRRAGVARVDAWVCARVP